MYFINSTSSFSYLSRHNPLFTSPFEWNSKYIPYSSFSFVQDKWEEWMNAWFTPEYSVLSSKFVISILSDESKDCPSIFKLSSIGSKIRLFSWGFHLASLLHFWVFKCLLKTSLYLEDSLKHLFNTHSIAFSWKSRVSKTSLSEV